MEKEIFINEILNSTNGITKVAPSDSVFQNIEQRIQGKVVPMKTLWLVAASIVILVSINISLLMNNQTTNDEATTVLAANITKSNQLY